MRTLLVALALVTMVGGSLPPVVDASAFSNTQSAPTVMASKTKRYKKDGKISVSIELADIPSVKRGKDIELVAHVANRNPDKEYTCEFKVIYDDQTEEEPDRVDLDDGRCELTVEVTNDSDAVGPATARVTLRDNKGKKKATHERSFTVRNSRA
jgi:hypothetical protein